ncbi:MAG: YiiX/YebB-like N1pC/P60 family cysteine hydrolase [Burkholderiaceae bacterium]|nr:YiiX/YebB-like N1pC/P60 family cysteine hydrolase [Burkholderiaceae bacterium]
MLVKTLSARCAGAFGSALARYLAQPRHTHGTSAPADLGALATSLRPADVILVEGETRFSTAVKYLTQSTWSHAALFVGDRLGLHNEHGEALVVMEADVVEGVRAVPLSSYAGLHLRVCRPVSLRDDEARTVIDHVAARLGHRYDLKNVFDLVRYLLPTPPVPLQWRRRLLALGSGDPTRAICSTLVAQAFQSVHYPILPLIEQRSTHDPLCPACVEEILHVRHHSLFVPRDFDVSPYFAVIKPTLAAGFDHHALRWAPTAEPQPRLEGVPA